MTTVNSCLSLPALVGAEILAGAPGMARTVSGVHVIDIPEITPWVRPGLIILSTGHGRSAEPDEWVSLVQQLDDHQVAAFCIALGRYTPSLPAEALAEANARQFPIIRLPWEIPFIQITESIHLLIIEEQRNLVEQFSRWQTLIVQAALSARSLSDLLRTLSRIIAAPLHLLDGDGEVMAAAGQLEAPSQSIPIPAGLPSRYYLAVPLDSGLTPLMEYIALVLGLYLLREQVAARTEAKLQSSFLHMVLRHEFVDDQSLRDRAYLLGFHFDRPHALLVIKLASESDHTTPSRWIERVTAAEDLLRKLLEQFTPLITTVDDAVVVVLRTDPQAAALPILRPFFEQFPGSAGIATDAIAATELGQVYTTVANVLPLAPAGTLTPLDHLLFPRIITNLPADLMESYWTLTWGKLQDAVLQETLSALVCHHGQIQATAETLHIHRNTLHYRMTQLEQHLHRPLSKRWLNELYMVWAWRQSRLNS